MSGKLKQIKREFEKVQDEIQCQKLLLRDIVLIYKDEKEIKYLQKKYMNVKNILTNVLN